MLNMISGLKHESICSKEIFFFSPQSHMGTHCRFIHLTSPTYKLDNLCISLYIFACFKYCLWMISDTGPKKRSGYGKPPQHPSRQRGNYIFTCFSHLAVPGKAFMSQTYCLVVIEISSGRMF